MIIPCLNQVVSYLNRDVQCILWVNATIVGGFNFIEETQHMNLSYWNMCKMRFAGVRVNFKANIDMVDDDTFGRKSQLSGAALHLIIIILFLNLFFVSGNVILEECSCPGCVMRDHTIIIQFLRKNRLYNLKMLKESIILNQFHW
jgi:hypothetical protein